MGSWSRKIYLLFWVSLIGLTGLGAYLIPRILDSAQEQGYREIDGQGKPPTIESLTGSVSTRFPTRPITDEDPTEDQPEQPERQAFPVVERPPSGSPTAASGLPQREVPTGMASAEPAKAPVTSRIRVVANSSVFESPRTTARVLGTVPEGTQVRWQRTAEPGWEEILLRDGRSVYMQSGTLALSGSGGESAQEAPVPAAGEDDGSSVSQLPSTVDSFLAILRDGDLLRASTYLAPGAPPLEEPDLGAWAALVGPEAGARISRIEPAPEGGSEVRTVLVADQSGTAQVQTTWKWDSRQERWLLSEWR